MLNVEIDKNLSNFHSKIFDQEDEDMEPIEPFRKITKEILLLALRKASVRFLLSDHGYSFEGNHQGYEHWAYVRQDIETSKVIDHLNSVIRKINEKAFLENIIVDYRENFLKKKTLIFFEIKPRLGLDAYNAICDKYSEQKIKKFCDDMLLIVEEVKVIILYQDCVIQDQTNYMSQQGYLQRNDQLKLKVISHIKFNIKEIHMREYELPDLTYTSLFRKYEELLSKNNYLESENKTLKNQLNIK